LGLCFTRPGESFYLNEIVRLTGIGLGPVQRELAQLLDAGILGMTRKGRSTFYQANSKCPIYDELKSIVVKTFGLAEVLREALQPLASRIKSAFVYGSFARSGQNGGSDIDLLVISDDLEFKDLVAATRAAQDRLGREINPILFTSAEYALKLRRGHHFVRSVADSPKIVLIGDEHEPGRMGKKRLA
jgi:predicted nucleotidyltransferase